MRSLCLVVMLLLSACATPRSAGILGINYSDQPARVAMRWSCNGKSFATQGTGVCEQKGTSSSQVSIKIPPLEGRVIYSNGQLKKTEDFNWYPKEGFWLWKKKPIKDTWADLDLGEVASTFGDWPVALDVASVGPSGLIVTRGMIYHRICNDQDIPCSKLVVQFECSGVEKATAANEIGKCERMSGSTQPLRVQLKGPGYQATPGAKIYISAPRLGISGQSYTPLEDEFKAGEMKLELPQVPNGPTLVGVRMAWLESGVAQHAETRILVEGFSPNWTGLDQPHWRADGDDQLEFVKPVLSDALEANLYLGRELRKKVFTTDKTVSLPRPQGSEIACAFAWQRDASDQTVVCINAQLQEVSLP